MKKLLGLALCTWVLIVSFTSCSASPPSAGEADPSAASSPSSEMAAQHQGDEPVASPAAQDVPAGTVTDGEVVYGTVEGKELTGYLAQPAGQEQAELPGLIVIQEWWGLNDHIRTMTRRLAAEGYQALAVDLYDDQVATTPDQARTLVQSALENPEQLTQNVVAAYRYLTDEHQAPKVGSIGWCFGGTWALNTALALPADLDAAVIYYGGQIATDRATLSPLEMPIQGHFGELDQNPSPEQVAAFEQSLADLDKQAEIYLYPDAGHAFANPSGTRYSAAAAELAWQRTVDFLKQHLT